MVAVVGFFFQFQEFRGGEERRGMGESGDVDEELGKV